MSRHVKFVMRNPIVIRVKIFQAVFTVFFAASLWWETGNHGSNIDLTRRFNLIGLAFFLTNNLTFPTSMGIVLIFP